MARMIVILTVLVAAVAGQGQGPAFQQGLSVHNAQIQAHLAKEAELARLSGPAQRPQQYQAQGQGQYQGNYQGGEDDGQYRPELYENSARAVQNNPQQNYQDGIKAHQAQIQNHLARSGSFAPQQQQNYQGQSQGQLGAGVSDPAYQQGLQLHQRQIQNHIAQEQQHGGPGPQSYQAPQQSYQQQYSAPPQYQQRQQNYNAPAPRGGSQAEFQSGIAAHMQQLLEHSRAEQQHQALTGQAGQYHAAQDGGNYRG